MTDIIDLARSFEIFAKYANHEIKIRPNSDKITIMLNSNLVCLEDAIALDDLGWKIKNKHHYILILNDTYTISKDWDKCKACSGAGHKTEECPYA